MLPDMMRAAPSLLILLGTLACGGEGPGSSVQGSAPVEGAGSLCFEVRGEGEPLVLIHGGNLDLRMWDDQFDLLAERFRTVRYDVRGFGCSTPADVEHAAHEDLLALLDHLEIERAHLVGLSLGGRIAVDFALVHPDRVGDLVLAGPGLSGWQFSPAPWHEKLREAVRSGDVEAISKAWLESDYMAPAMENPDLADRLRAITVENDDLWLRDFRERGLDPPAVERLEELQAPVLLILGDRDVPDIQAIVELLEQKVPGARKVVIEGAGHMVNMERPDEFNRAMLDFLGRSRTER
jgi:pimeloyl-ACP methyl ester carboxylesterase